MALPSKYIHNLPTVPLDLFTGFHPHSHYILLMAWGTILLNPKSHHDPPVFRAQSSTGAPISLRFKAKAKAMAHETLHNLAPPLTSLTSHLQPLPRTLFQPHWPPPCARHNSPTSQSWYLLSPWSFTPTHTDNLTWPTPYKSLFLPLPVLFFITVCNY